MDLKRTFAIGEECIYLKIYTRNFFADKILIKISQLLSPKILKGDVTKWFFIRYNDPGFHLRVRIFIADKSKFSEILFSINELLQEEIKTKIATVVLDSYVREIERYDPLCIELFENLFFQNTLIVIRFLDLLEEGHLSEDDRWIFGLISIDKNLVNFQLTLNEKHVFVKNNNLFFSKEFEKDKNLNKQLDAAFRENEDLIESNLTKITELSTLIDQKSEKIKILAHEINILNQKELLTQNIYNLLGSYIHMNCNRLFRVEPRKQEYILYDFLTRFYTKQFYTKPIF